MRWWLGALLLLAAGIVLRMGFLVYAMYVFLGLLWFSRLRAQRWTHPITVDRQVTVERADIGESAEVTISVRNTGRGRVPWLLIEEGVPLQALRQSPPRLRVTGGHIAVAALGPGKSRTNRQDVSRRPLSSRANRKMASGGVSGRRRSSSAAITYRVDFLMRGYYQFGPTLLESGDLFGLHRRFEVVSEPRFVLVRPKVLPLEGYDFASRRPIGEVRIRHRLFEDPTRINGIRPYQRGDPLNRVHWRATARTGLLHSKTYEPSCVAGATLLLNFHAESFVATRSSALSPEVVRRLATQGIKPEDVNAGGPDVRLVELAITAAASLANAVDELGQPIGLVTNGRDAADRIRREGWRTEFRSRSMAHATLNRSDANERLQPVIVETRRGTGQLPQILDALARLELTDGLPFEDLVTDVMPRLPRDATVAAILTHVSEQEAIALGTLRRNGFAVTAVVVSFEEVAYHDWASPPDWAGRLMAEGIPFRRIEDEAGLTQLCAEHFVQ